MKKLKRILFSVAILLVTIYPNCNLAFAEERDMGIGMSPMNQKIILIPGETYHGTFKITNPAGNAGNFKYIIHTNPFYVNDSHEIVYSNNGDYNQMVNWVTLPKERGEIAPNNTEEVYFMVNVPKDAPAGGQYAAIVVTSDNNDSELPDGINLNVKYAMAHIVYAEIAGTTVRKGEVTSADVPGFLFSGNIAGNSTIKNTGNVHSTATYKLQVFPLFSNEEIYTNEEDPETKTILPDRTLYNSTVWNNTPSMGIFNVVYTAEFEGVTTEVKKMVIVCPLWLLAVIIFGVILVIIWLASKNKSRKKK